MSRYLLACAFWAILAAANPVVAQNTSTPPSEPGDPFDLDDVARLLGESRGDGVELRRAPTETEREERMRYAVRDHIKNCWEMPSNVSTMVVVRFTLNADGSLATEPRIIHVEGPSRRHRREAQRAAIDAIRRCDPFPMASDPGLAQHYQDWREMEFLFRTEEDHPPRSTP